MNLTWTELLEALQALFTPQNAVLAVLAVVVLLYFWARVRRLRYPPEVFAFQTATGEVFVTSSAVADLVHKISMNTDGVAKVSSRLYRRGARLQVHLRLHLRANYVMRDVARQLEERIAKGLKRMYGVESIDSIRTVVAGVVGQPEVTDSPPEEIEEDRYFVRGQDDETANEESEVAEEDDRDDGLTKR